MSSGFEQITTLLCLCCPYVDKLKVTFGLYSVAAGLAALAVLPHAKTCQVTKVCCRARGKPGWRCK